MESCLLAFAVDMSLMFGGKYLTSFTPGIKMRSVSRHDIWIRDVKKKRKSCKSVVIGCDQISLTATGGSLARSVFRS